MEIPDQASAELTIEGRTVRLTNLHKPFWPELNITKRELLQYYADIAPALLPHLADRAMVMKRYPNGAAGDFFFMKRTPPNSPEWLRTCSVKHGSGNIIDFPVIDDLAALLWVINLGCIDLNPWYARCDDVDRPDYLHFDLDPVPGAKLKQVLQTACAVHEALDALKMPSFPKPAVREAFTSTFPLNAGLRRSKCGPSPRNSPAPWRPNIRIWSPRNIKSRSGRKRMSW